MGVVNDETAMAVIAMAAARPQIRRLLAPPIWKRTCIRRLLATEAATAPLKNVVLYDGGCALCAWEISHYQKLDQDRSISWLNLQTTESDAVLKSLGVEKKTALDAIHILDAEGQLQIGADAFPSIWDQLPYFRYLSPPFRFAMGYVPGFRPVVEWGYRKFVTSQL